MKNKFKMIAKANAEGVTEYGIATANNETMIAGISVNKNTVETLTDKFNKSDLSEIHLDEAVDDFINDL